MEFNHLADTRFPNFDTVHPYQFKNEFDYSRWIPGTKITLCNVPWDSGFENTVKFENDEERDNYFNSLESDTVILDSVDTRVLPDNYVKVPVPFDMAAKYNYMFVDVPIATGNAPIDYEGTNGFKRWHFFITNINYMAPNTTQIYLLIDSWTQYINSVDISYMMLERGHAPVYASDTDDYLANPIANAKYLLAPDVTYDDVHITRKCTDKLFGAGEKFICIVTSYEENTIVYYDTIFGMRTQSSSYSPSTPYYTNTQERWGYQATPNDYGFGNGYDYLICKSRTDLDDLEQVLTPNNVRIYAIPAEQCYSTQSAPNGVGFFEHMFKERPTFANGIHAMFMVSESMIELDRVIMVDNYQVYTVRQEYVSTLDGIELSKEDFGYAEQYERFAKLYTYPYASIELSDNKGNVREVKIEDISGDNRLIQITALSFPYLNFRAFFSGIGGNHNKNTAVWRSLNGSTGHTANLYESDWLEYALDFNIPAFALYQSAEDDYMAHSFNRSIMDNINQYWTSYTTDVPDANNAKANSDDAANTAKVNADNIANMNKFGADSNAATAFTNAGREIDLLKDQHTNARANKVSQYNTRVTNDNIMMNNAITNTIAIIALTNQANWDRVNNNNTASYITQLIQNQASIATTASTADAQIKSGTVSGGVSGATGGIMQGAGLTGMISGAMAAAEGGAALGPAGLIGGAVIGGIIGGASGALSSHYSADVTAEAMKTNAIITTNADSAVVSATITANTNATAIDNQLALDVQAKKNAKVTYDNTWNHRMQDDLLTLENDLDLANTNLAATTSSDNAYDLYQNAIAIAANNELILKQNALNTKSVTNSNAKNTRNLTVRNEQMRLLASRNTGMAQLADAANRPTVTLTPYSGDIEQIANANQAMSIRVKTQSDSAIAQAGDIFARFGYALNQVWNVAESGLCLMEHFTYWKSSEIWIINKRGGNTSDHNIIKNAFERGVTVWSNPDDLGRVSIYDN